VARPLRTGHQAYDLYYQRFSVRWKPLEWCSLMPATRGPVQWACDYGS